MKRLSLCAVLGLSVAGSGAVLRAQGVTVTDPVWFLSDPPPDVLPAPKRRLGVDYPDEMKKTAELGYVVLRRYVDADGESRVLQAVGTHLPFQRAVEAAMNDWKFTPGKSAGHSVDGAVWMAVLFNPRSADSRRPDATPRLLAAAPAFTRRQVAPDGAPPVINVKLDIGTDGEIAGAVLPEGLKSNLKRAIEEALGLWRFAPARQNGQPVAADITVPVLCLPPAVPLEGKATPPKVVRRKGVVYPYAMRRFGLEGQVAVDFIVDAEGAVRNAYVSSSNNPAFDDNAVVAVRQWKFEPGLRNGRPIATHMRVPIIFQLDGGAVSDAFFISDRVDQSKLPPALRFDTVPKIRNVQIPVYPYAMLQDRVYGKAKVTMLIDQNGKISDVKIISADKPEFGLALATAVQGWLFDPALKDGKPVPHLLAFEQTFSTQELPDADPDDLIRLEAKHPEKIVGARELDTKLKPLSRSPAHFPVTIDPHVIDGEAEVECLVDEHGRVRLPRVVSASEPAFGYAAVQAASAWWFEPPKSGGKAAVVRVRIPFKFHMADAKQPANP